MKHGLARYREARSFAAGILIGLSVVVPVFALMEANPSTWQTLSLLGSPFMLALGLALQAVVVAGSAREREIAATCDSAHTTRRIPRIDLSEGQSNPLALPLALTA